MSAASSPAAQHSGPEASPPCASGPDQLLYFLEGLIPPSQVNPKRHLVRVPGGDFHRVRRCVEHPSGMWIICTPVKEWCVPGWALVQTIDKARARELTAEAHDHEPYPA